MNEYNNLEEVEHDIRKGKIYDIIKVNGIIFTQDNYDMSGKEVSYGNKKEDKCFIVETEDRYKEGFSDAIVSWVESPCFRNDIHYYDDLED